MERERKTEREAGSITSELLLPLLQFERFLSEAAGNVCHSKQLFSLLLPAHTRTVRQGEGRGIVTKCFNFLCVAFK